MKSYQRCLLFSFFALLSGGFPLCGEVKVASLHPLMTDLVRQVGGEEVEIVEIGKVGFSVHRFEPTAQDLIEMGACQAVFASGKGIETYLPDLRDALGDVLIVEVGETIPSRSISDQEALCSCCDHDHSHSDTTNLIDPHWWHDVTNMERAVKVVEKSLVGLAPEHADQFKERSLELRSQYEDLDRWVIRQLGKIPEEQRTLVTAHAAFGYFCKKYEMEPVYVLGMSAQHEVPAKELVEELVAIKEKGIRAVFPELKSNPKVLQQLANETGAKIGEYLVADGAVESYEGMIRNNVSNIVSALGE